MTVHAIAPHDRRRWWPPGYDRHRTSLATPSQWVSPPGTKCGETVYFIAVDSLGTTGLTIGEDGDVVWDACPPEDAYLTDVDDWCEAEGPEGFVELLMVLWDGIYDAAPRPGTRIHVKVERRTVIACRLAVVDDLVVVEATDPLPPLADPLPTPLGPATPMTPGPDL